jgi:proteasome lid subunit RPN8/RPN11
VLNHLDEIFKHVEAEYPSEACGIIAEKDGEEVWFPCLNIAEDSENSFELNKLEYMNILLNTEKILAIVHSHTNESAEPSKHDISACNFLELPYLIVNWPGKEVKFMNPGEYK